MKKLIITLTFTLFVGIAFSQTVNDYMEVQRAALKTEKKGIVAEAMQLTEEESTVFWPLYNEYNEKSYIINTKVYNLVQKYADEFETLTSEQAVELWNESMKIKNESSKLKNTYFKKFLKIMDGKKVVRYFQTENKIADIVNYQITMEVPLVE